MIHSFSKCQYTSFSTQNFSSKKLHCTVCVTRKPTKFAANKRRIGYLHNPHDAIARTNSTLAFSLLVLWRNIWVRRSSCEGILPILEWTKACKRCMLFLNYSKRKKNFFVLRPFCIKVAIKLQKFTVILIVTHECPSNLARALALAMNA